MDILTWIIESFKSGELFFYIVPFFIFIVLLIIIFTPDAKKRSSKKTPSRLKVEEKDSHCENVKFSEPVPPGVDSDYQSLKKGRTGFKTLEITPDAKKGDRESHKTIDLTIGEKYPETETGGKTLEEGLAKTKVGFVSKLKNLFSSGNITPELMEEMEEILYTADMGVKTVAWLLDEIKKNKSSFQSGEDIKLFLKAKVLETLKGVHRKLPELSEKPAVVLMVGVNGAGKTTTIGKLADRFIKEGKKVVFAASDTFRAAAVEQLKIWGEKTSSTVISDKDGADPASVAFNAISSAVSKNADIVFIDTAGRLQNRVNLMEELSKVNRVAGKAKEGAPHETILVIDANNGQNALSQAKEFGESVNVSGIILTKLDGTAKGGVLIGIARELSLPVYMVGVGEGVKDLIDFDPDVFVEALFS